MEYQYVLKGRTKKENEGGTVIVVKYNITKNKRVKEDMQ